MVASASIELTAEQCAALRDRRNAVLSHHHWFHIEISRLEGVAWRDARALSSTETVAMIHSLTVFKQELARHCKFAAVLVYPFVGESRGQRFVQAHLDRQSVVEAAANTACARARGKLSVELPALTPRLTAFFAAERELIVVPIEPSTVQLPSVASSEAARHA